MFYENYDDGSTVEEMQSILTEQALEMSSELKKDSDKKYKREAKSHEEFTQLEEDFGIDKDVYIYPGICRNYKKECHYSDSILSNHFAVRRDCHGTEAFYANFTFEVVRDIMYFSDIDTRNVNVVPGEGFTDMHKGIFTVIREVNNYYDRINRKGEFLNKWQWQVLKYPTVFTYIDDISTQEKVIDWFDLIFVEWTKPDIQEARMAYRMEVCLDDLMSEYVKTNDKNVRKLIKRHVELQKYKGHKTIKIIRFLGQHEFGEGKNAKCENGFIDYLDVSYLFDENESYTEKELEFLGYYGEDEKINALNGEIEIGRQRAWDKEVIFGKTRRVNNIFATSFLNDSNSILGVAPPQIIRTEQEAAIHASIQRTQADRQALKHYMVYQGNSKMTQKDVDDFKDGGFMQIGPNETFQFGDFPTAINEYAQRVALLEAQAKKKIGTGLSRLNKGLKRTATEVSQNAFEDNTAYSHFAEVKGLAIERKSQVLMKRRLRKATKEDHLRLHGDPRTMSAVRQFLMHEFWIKNFDSIVDKATRITNADKYTDVKIVDGVRIGKGKPKKNALIRVPAAATIDKMISLSVEHMKEFYGETSWKISLKDMKKKAIDSMDFWAEVDVTIENNKSAQKFQELSQMLQLAIQNPSLGKDPNKIMNDLFYHFVDGNDTQYDYSPEELEERRKQALIQQARQAQAQQLIAQQSGQAQNANVGQVQDPLAGNADINDQLISRPTLAEEAVQN